MQFILDCSVAISWCLVDAAYLELAIRLELPIATLDTRLAEAAIRCGVGLVVVDG